MNPSKFIIVKRPMIKKILIFCILNGIVAPSFAVQPQPTQDKMLNIFSAYKKSTEINPDNLAPPYNYLLIQPMMTKGITTYYQRTPIIQTLYAAKNHQNNTYNRAIRMIVDTNKTRNNAKLAQSKNEMMVVELAFITMNFNELSEKIIHDVQVSNKPFGQLLLDNHVKIKTKDRSYFALKCDKELESLTHCFINSTIYGRTNTIIRVDNKWLAHVVEILPGFTLPK